MPDGVKLCAIAMNEGPYLTDWVFHHLYFGFDAIEVWVNGSQDESMGILAAIHSTRKNVTFKVVDDLLDASVREGRYFQYRAYARLAKKVTIEGYAHVAFLDLDEYWVPRDFVTKLPEFVPQNPEVNVISFQWCTDVPDHSRRAFSHPLSGSVNIQMDAHVKSVVRLDDRVKQFRPHTARTTGGDRLLVRDPFPLREERGQQWGSFVPADQLSSTWDHLPDAFVLHAIHRSVTEYVGSLNKAFRRSPTDSHFRTNRRGFVARKSPVLPMELPDLALRNYFESLSLFRAEVGTDSYTRSSELLAIRRGEVVLDAAASDPLIMEQMRGALRGISESTLDQRYPGWHSHVEWCIDDVVPTGNGAFVVGWAFSEGLDQDLEFAFRNARGREWPPDSVDWSVRPDVANAYPGAPINCGFRIGIPTGLAAGAGTNMLARPEGSTVWSSLPLPSQLTKKRTRGG